MLFMFAVCAHAEWSFDWTTKLDRMGKPPGIYTNTPFPIIESSNSYIITNDDNLTGKEFILGTLYFVDGGAADDTGSGLAFDSPKQLLASALTLAGSNVNATIIVRGAHDAFDGVYTSRHIIGNYPGLDDTHRMMIVGYGQERPNFNGYSSPGTIFSCFGLTSLPTNIFFTLQRLAFIGATNQCIAVGYDSLDVKRGGYLNVIDCYGSNITASSTANVHNGLIYWMNADNGWCFHNSVDRIDGHGVKMGDGASYITAEWNDIKNISAWEGKTGYWNRGVGLDFPSDREGGRDHTIRYNIISNICAYGVQCRRSTNFVIKYNDISAYGQGYSMSNNPGASAMSAANGILVAATSYGDIYNNKLHDVAVSNYSSVIIISSSIIGDVKIYNNIIYNNTNSDGIYSDNGNYANIYCYNNTFVLNNTNSCVRLRSATGTPNYWFTNNIFHQTGSGGTLQRVIYTSPPTPEHGYNVHYCPIGMGSYWALNGTELTNNPILTETYYLDTGSPAIGAGANLSSIFTTDINDAARPAVLAWDVGAYVSSTVLPPLVTITAPVDGSIQSPGSVTLTATISDNLNVTNLIWYTNDMAAWTNTAAPWTASLSFPASNDIAISAYAETSDSTNAWSTTTNTVYIRVPLQSLTLTAPVNGSVHQGAIVFTAAPIVGDGSLTNVTFYLGGASIGSAVASPWSVTNTAVAGVHSWYGRAWDTNGFAVYSTTTNTVVKLDAQLSTNYVGRYMWVPAQ